MNVKLFSDKKSEINSNKYVGINNLSKFVFGSK